MKLLKDILFGLCFVSIILLSVVKTGLTMPPDEALVYLDIKSNTFYPPHKAPENATLIPVSYKMAKDLKAKPFNIQGFYIDGPSILVGKLYSLGIWPWSHLKWAENGSSIENYVAEDPKEKLQKIPPMNYESPEGDFIFPKHENIQYEYARDICTFYAIQQLKFNFPKTPISQIIEASKKHKTSQLSVITNLCVLEYMTK